MPVVEPLTLAPGSGGPGAAQPQAVIGANQSFITEAGENWSIAVTLRRRISSMTAFLIGPIGVYAGAALANLLSPINTLSPLLFAILIPMLYPFLVPLGLHWPLNALMLANISTLGYDFIQGPMGTWNFACFGATAGVLVLAMREKDVAMRQTATGALAAGLLGGISEPSLYGIHLRFKKIYSRLLPGCLVGGLIIGFGGGLKTSAFVFTSLLTIPAFSNIPLYVAAITAAFLTSMVFWAKAAPAPRADMCVLTLVGGTARTGAIAELLEIPAGAAVYDAGDLPELHHDDEPLGFWRIMPPIGDDRSLPVSNGGYALRVPAGAAVRGTLRWERR